MKADKTFNGLTKEECLMVYPRLVENSDNLLDSAKLLSNAGYFGTSISHLVLSSEEIVKGLVIFLDGKGLQIRRVKHLNKIFYNHLPRHSFALFFYLIMKILIPIIKLGEKFTKHFVIKSKSDKSILSGDDYIKLSNKDPKLLLENVYGMSTFSLTKRGLLSVDFWTEADNLKMRGFYVDYKNELLLPSNINKTEYLRALDAVISFNDECKFVINWINQLKTDEQSQLISEIHNNGFVYDLIEKILSAFNKKTSKH